MLPKRVESMIADGCLRIPDALVLLLPAEVSGHKLQKAIKTPAEGQAESSSCFSACLFRAVCLGV